MERNGRNCKGSDVRIDIAAEDIGQFIGKGGKNIRRMERESNARIKVLKEEESKSRGSVPVSISGDEAAKSKAKQLVDEFNKMYSLEAQTTRKRENSNLLYSSETKKIIEDSSAEHVVEVIDEEDKHKSLLKFMNEMKPDDKAIVFVDRRSHCDEVASILHSTKSFTSQCLHGGLEQAEMDNILEKFKSGETRVLVTDVMSRGGSVCGDVTNYIFDDVTHVINYDFPKYIADYLDRIEKFGRAGQSGKLISFFTRNDWGAASELILILRKAKAKIPDELPVVEKRFERIWLGSREKKRSKETFYLARKDGSIFAGSL